MCKTTDLGLHPKTGVSFTEPTECPINGFGGSWYNQPFGFVPVYNRGAIDVNDQITWADIDRFAAIIANIWVTTGACLGLCLVVFAYIIALTPSKKRGMPFHTSLLLALVCEMGRLISDVARASNVGLSPYPAYLALTGDYEATTYSSTFQALDIAGLIFAPLAFFFTAICLYLQACSLLTGLHLRHREFYFSIITYLLVASFIALGLRIIITVIQAMYNTNALNIQNIPLATISDLRRATTISYAVSIGSWCMVSFVSVVWLIATRSKLIVTNRLFDTALTLLSLVFVESFVIPLVFIILQAFPAANIPLAELVVIPSVLVLLPMGSLFMTMHSAEINSSPGPSHERPPSIPNNHLPELESGPLVAVNRSAIEAESHPLTSFRSRAPLAANPVDRELQAIDSMSMAESEEPIFGTTDTDAALAYGTRKIQRALGKTHAV